MYGPFPDIQNERDFEVLDVSSGIFEDVCSICTAEDTGKAWEENAQNHLSCKTAKVKGEIKLATIIALSKPLRSWCVHRSGDPNSSWKSPNLQRHIAEWKAVWQGQAMLNHNPKIPEMEVNQQESTCIKVKVQTDTCHPWICHRCLLRNGTAVKYWKTCSTSWKSCWDASAVPL